MGSLFITIVIALIFYSISNSANKNKKNEDKYKDNKIEIIQKKYSNKNVNQNNKKTELLGDLLEIFKPYLSPEDKEKLEKNEKKKSNAKVNAVKKNVKTKEETNILLEQIKKDRDAVKQDFKSTISLEEENQMIDFEVKKEFTKNEIVKAIIMKEILDKPVSMRES